MCLHQLANVERLETFEQAVPDDGDKSWCGNDLRKLREAFRHFAARGSPLQQRPDGCDDAGKNLPIVEFGKLWKAAPFRNHEAHDVFPPRFINLADEDVGNAISQDWQRYIGLSHFLDCPNQRREHRPDQLLEQALLVAEVEIDRAFGDARAARHILKTSGLETAAREFVEGGG